MTEETDQTATDQPVQEKMTTIYASTNKIPFAAMLIPKKWANIGNVYPMTTIKPDPSLKSPKMDWNQMKWFENDKAKQGSDMATLKQEVDTLNGKGQESDTKIDQLLQISVRTSQTLGQLLADNKKSSATTSTADKPTQSATTSTDVKGGAQ